MTALARPFVLVPPRWGRIAALTLTGAALVIAAASLWTLQTDQRFAYGPGFDFGLYRDAAARWLAGGPFYLPVQVAGPYDTATIPAIMYPPPTLLWFAPFTILPAFLWWAIPLAVIGAAIYRLRPAIWTWPLMALALAWPFTVELAWTGNPSLWITAVLALATRWPAASVLVFAKPSLFPFALIGVRSRWWWLTAGVLAVLSLPFLPMWLDWIRVVLNARGSFSGLLYSLHDLPMVVIPLIAWAGRTNAAPVKEAACSIP